MNIFQVVKFDGLRSRNWLVYKHPCECITYGSQLIVGQGQAAIFVNSGVLCDVYEAGNYTLNTDNIPLLSRFFNIPFNRKTPYPVDIFFVNLTGKLDLHWGTPKPIQLIDPKYFVKLRIRAFGQFSLKIDDYLSFFQDVIGVMPPASVVNYDEVLNYYKGIFTTTIKTTIADVIINKKVSALEITARLDDLSADVYGVLKSEVKKFGFTLVNLFINSINFPEEDFERINKILEKKAEFEIMGDQRYVTSRSFDVYETAAGNEGGAAGAFVAGGVGLGAGAALATSMQQQIISPNIGLQVEPVSAGEKPCPNCGESIPSDSRFCSSCGISLAEKTCSCGALLPPQAKFCLECGREVA